MRIIFEKKWQILLIISAFLFIDLFLQIIGNMTTDPVMADFHIDKAQLGLLNSAYFWSYLLMQIPAGMLLDRFGAKRVLNPALLCIIIGSIIFSLTHNIYFAFGGRLIIGLGSSFGFIGLLFVVSQLFTSNSIYFIFGLGVLFSSLALTLMQYLAPTLIAYLGWRSMYDLIAVAGAILLLVMFLKLDDSHPSKNIANIQPNFIRGALLSVTKTASIWLIGIFSFGTASIYTIFACLWAGPFLAHFYQLNLEQASSFITWIMLGMAFGAPLLGWINKKFNQPKMLMFLATTLLFISIDLVLYYKFNHFLILKILLFITGALTTINLLGPTLAGLSVKQEYQGTAIAFCNMISMLSSVIFQPMVGLLIDTWQKQAVPISLAYQRALLVLPCLIAISFITIFWIRMPKFNDNSNK